jgi:hypothetical protein
MSNVTRSRRLAAAASAVVLAPAVAALVASVTPASAGTQQSAAPGPAAVYSGYKDQFQLVTAANRQVEVGRLALPAGSYTISAKLNLGVANNGYNEHIRCYLRAGGDYDRAIANHDGTIAFVPMSMNVVHTFTGPDAAVLTCGHDFTSGTTPVSFVKITAVRASSLVNTPMR